MRTSLLRTVALAVLTGMALLLGTAPAWAHTRLEGSSPADGATLDAGPPQISVTFSEAVQPGFSTLTVIGPDGVDYRSGEVSESDSTVTVGVTPLGPAGAYRIGYRVVSADGHPVSGSLGFTLTTAGPAAAAPSAAPPTSAAPVEQQDVVPTATPDDGDGGAPVWPWVVGAVVLVGAGVTAAMRLGRG